MSSTASSNRGSPLPERLDVLIIGAGFSGIYQLHLFRKLGFSSIKIVEAGSDIGGTWHWNCYPGARCDSEAQMYQLSIDELPNHDDWPYYSCKFPDFKEIRNYFEFLDEKLDVRRDVVFGTRVVSAKFDEDEHVWAVETDNGQTVRARFLSLCTGFASKPYIPDIKGLDSFQGICNHTGLWPQDGIDLSGKRVAVIGTGASGIQVIEEAAKVSKHVTVYQRTPNLALPMKQEIFTNDKKQYLKDHQAESFRIRRLNPSGHDIPYVGSWNVSLSGSELGSDTENSARELLYEELFEKGGFHITKAGFKELFFDQECNDWVYAFWRRKVRERLKDRDEWLKEKMAPKEQPHPFGVKRVALEQTFYDVFAQDNVSLVDIKDTPITEITPTGISTSNGEHQDFDIIVLATGFDGVTGGITQIDIKGTNGQTIQEKWTGGVETNLGLTANGFPNMFFVYAAHGVTALGNGPTCLVCLVDYSHTQQTYIYYRNNRVNGLLDASDI
ncbi:hypothetical protein ONZ45_g12594 [Pleurotus djamor]|nr:hypothetical protein ONZ45_g12594 [Pleurotus djamor]